MFEFLIQTSDTFLFYKSVFKVHHTLTLILLFLVLPTSSVIQLIPSLKHIVDQLLPFSRFNSIMTLLSKECKKGKVYK